MPKKGIRINIADAKAALDAFKMQAKELGITLNEDGYNGNLTSKQDSSTGTQKSKKTTKSCKNSTKKQ